MKTSRYLDLWTAKKIREAYPDIEVEDPCGGDGVMREAIDRYTVRKLEETLAYAIAHSAFYAERFGEAAGRMFSLAERAGSSPQTRRLQEGRKDRESFFRRFEDLPFTTPEDLKKREMDLLCVGPGEISRIVTLDTGGSTGEPKRIYFTEADQQLTVDFFGNGMQLLVDSGDNVLILMPAKMPGSIGRLLAQGLKDFGVDAIPYGLPQIRPLAEWEQNRREADRILALMREKRVASVVALPTHMRMLAESCGKGAFSLKSVLLSAEYVSDDDVALIEDVFGCKVYEHYGMTEMGLGGAVSCGMGDGYHIREPDLYIEIVDPEGRPIQDGRPGEVVFTTLTRKGMPFIRYRTGDYSSFITTPCQCGSVMKRISKVGKREQMKGYLR